MNTAKKIGLAALIAATYAQNAEATPVCGGNDELTTVHFSIPYGATETFATAGLPGDGGVFERLLINSIPKRNDVRNFRNTELKKVNEVWGVENTEHQAEIIKSDVANRTLDAYLCTDKNEPGFMSFAVAYDNGPQGVLSTTAHKRNGHVATSFTLSETNALGLDYNNGGAEEIILLAEESTGVTRELWPFKTTGDGTSIEALFSQLNFVLSQMYTTSQADFDKSLIVWENAYEEAGKVYVNAQKVGDVYSLLDTTGYPNSIITDVKSDGASILDNNKEVKSLKTRIGKDLTIFADNQREIGVYAGSPIVNIGTSSCVNGKQTITATPTYAKGFNATLDGIVGSTSGDKKTWSINCDKPYTLRAWTKTPRGKDLATEIYGTGTDDSALEYVNFWLPDNDSKFYLSNNEIRAMINGGQGTRSYATDLAEIIVNNTPGIPFDVEFWKQTLLDYADGNTSNDEFRLDFDPILWSNDAFGTPNVRIYDNFPINSVTDFHMTPEGMQAMYELVRGIDLSGNPNGGFLVQYVESNADLYGGTLGGAPNLSHNPTWNTQDPN